jgi:hypothetical protein
MNLIHCIPRLHNEKFQGFGDQWRSVGGGLARGVAGHEGPGGGGWRFQTGGDGRRCGWT